MPSVINLLHLSDLHFGVENHTDYPQTALARRRLTLEGLSRVIAGIEPEWRPDLVAITGDIAWKGQPVEYDAARGWIAGLLAELGLTVRDLVICAGNHDIDRRKTVGMPPPGNAKNADEWLTVENLENFLRPFTAFADFQRNLGTPEILLGNSPQPLVGTLDVKGLRFVVLNSAWFCRGDQDRNRLWLGLPLLQRMAVAGELADREAYDTAPLTIALLHHPPNWLNEGDTNSWQDRPNTLRYLAGRSHLILCGHTHAAIEQPDRKFGRAYLCTGGATYEGDRYRNNFSILRIHTDARMFTRRAWEFDPRFEKWQEAGLDRETYFFRTPAKSCAAIEDVLPPIPAAYANWLQGHCRDMEITRLIGTSPVIRVRLPELFIPLYTTAESDTEKTKEPPELSRMGKEHGRDIEDLALKGPSLVIEGPAGCGKTTLVKHMAFGMLGEEGVKGECDFLPVLVFLIRPAPRRG